MDTNSRILCSDIRDLGKQLLPVGMLVVLDSIFNRIIRNRALGKNTWLYIDEIYLLFQHEYSANFLFTLWKRVRKYGGCCTGLTQNVDDLHERAGSSYVIHLHGELMKVTSSRSPNDPRYIKTLDAEHLEVKIGDLAGDGSQLRPFIVWFGEPVPEIDKAVEECAKADMLIVIGTSLNVYPAAGLTRCVPPGTPIYLIDPKPVAWNSDVPVHHIMKGASEGMKELMEKLKR